MNLRIVNLTGVAVTILSREGKSVTFAPAKNPARVAVMTIAEGTVTAEGVSIPLKRSKVVGVENLPPPTAGILFIVPRAVAQVKLERDDLVVVHDLVRDHGRIVGAQELVKFSETPKEVSTAACGEVTPLHYN